MTWKEKLKRQWDENPMLVITVVTFALTGAAKFIDAWSAAKGRNAYARQIDYKISNRR
jgi:hypothetical protein